MHLSFVETGRQCLCLISVKVKCHTFLLCSQPQWSKGQRSLAEVLVKAKAVPALSWCRNYLFLRCGGQSVNKGMWRAVKKQCLSAQAMLCPPFVYNILFGIGINHYPFYWKYKISDSASFVSQMFWLKKKKYKKEWVGRKPLVLFFTRTHCSQRSLPCRMTQKPALAYPEQAFFWVRFYR